MKGDTRGPRTSQHQGCTIHSGLCNVKIFQQHETPLKADSTVGVVNAVYVSAAKDTVHSHEMEKVAQYFSVYFYVYSYC